MSDQVTMHIRENFCTGGYNVFLRHKNPQTGQLSIAEPATFTNVPPESLGTIPDPCFTLTADDLKKLMDDLWNKGFRPTEKPSCDDQTLISYQQHITDLREHIEFLRELVKQNQSFLPKQSKPNNKNRPDVPDTAFIGIPNFE